VQVAQPLDAGNAADAPPLGYERVVVGATTNFVGDAMSRGAVDLVRWRDAYGR
jgi:hypothetical protein